MSIKSNACDSIALWHFVPLQHSIQSGAVSLLFNEKAVQKSFLIGVHQPSIVHGLQLHFAVFKCHLHSVIEWMPTHTQKGENWAHMPRASVIEGFLSL